MIVLGVSVGLVIDGEFCEDWESYFDVSGDDGVAGDDGIVQ